LALAVASAILMTLAVPNEMFKHGLAPLGFVALIPLYVGILELPGPKTAALVTGVFGALQHGLTSFWLWFFEDYRIWTLGSTTLFYLVVYAVLGLYLWFFLSRGGNARPLGFILLWTCFEYQKSFGFLGYPWGLIPYSLTDALPLLQIADLAGVYGISAVLVACNAAIAELILGMGSPRHGLLPIRLRIGYSALAAALVLGSLGYGLVRIATPLPKVGSLDAILVQQNTDPWVDGDEDAAVATNIRLAREALAGATRKPDVIIFSETSLRRPYAESRPYFMQKPALDPLIPFIRDSGAWLLTGAPEIVDFVDWSNFGMTNSAILIDPQGRLAQSYAKIHPVPFAEAIPFMEIPWFKTFIQKTVGLESGWSLGKDFVIFSLPTKSGTLRFGVPICFEDAFADVCRNFSLGGADLLINLTNISWSKTESAEIQHWAAARFRAIEARKTLVRSTNGGVSAVIGPFGETLVSLPLFQSVSRFVEVPVFRSTSPTIYISWGDWFARATLLLSGALAILLIVHGWVGRRTPARFSKNGPSPDATSGR
jgi:apolipoprotein N-acyltransferase